MKHLLPIYQVVRIWRSWRSSLATLVTLFLALGTVQAQVDDYTFTPLTGAYTPITGGTNVSSIQVDDAISAPIPLGFTFVFDGTPYTSVKANSNGTLVFNQTSSPVGFELYSNGLSTAPASMRPQAAAFWEDLDGTSGTASYTTSGTAGSRIFTFQWQNWRRYADAGSQLNFQIRLYEGSNQLEFVYSLGAAPTSTVTASIGLAGTGTGSGSFLALSNASSSPSVSSTTDPGTIANFPATGQIYRFNPPVPSACPAPRNLTATALTGTTATLNWTVVSGGGSFLVEYGPQGFTPGQTPSAGTVVTVPAGTTSVNITGLTPSTPYQFYVTQICGGTAGNSTRSGPSGFSTTILNDEPCGAIALTLNPTGCTPVQATNTGATTTVPNGYTNPSVTGCGVGTAPKDVWYTVRTTASGAGSTSVSFDLVGNPAGLLRMFSAASCSGPFTIVACGSSGTNNTGLGVFTATGLTPNTTYYVAVSGNGSSDTQGSFTICATSLTPCGPARNLTATNRTGTSATLNWSVLSGGGSFIVEYGPQGFTPGQTPSAGTVVTTAPGATNVNITGLTPSTSYQFYVTQVCGGTSGNSTRTGPASFSTTIVNDEPCGAIALTLNSTGCTPVQGTNTAATTTVPSGYTNPPVTGCGTGTAPKDVWYTVRTNATGAGSTSISFEATGNPAGLLRMFSAASCSGPFTIVACGASGATNTALGVFTATGLTPNTTYYVSISGYGSFDTQGAFTLCATSATLCPSVRSITASNLNSTGATLTFNATGGATSYTVVTTPLGGTPVTTTATTSPITLTGLTPFTQYTVTITANCSGGTTSSPVTTTFVTNPYCTTNLGGGVCGATDMIGAVRILNTTLDNPNTACNQANGSTYTSFPATGSTTATLSQGSSYQLSVTPTGGAIISAWIDYDQDGQLEATEWVQVATNATAGVPSVVTITVPTTAASGRTLLRIRSRGTGNLNGASDACSNFGSGETEDYFITIGNSACPGVTNLAISNLVARSATVNFTASASATNYTVTATPQGGGTPISVSATASPVNLTGLLPSTTYDVCVISNCAAGLTSTVCTSLTTPIAPPLNDDPCGATVLTVSGTTTP
ncbi:fibronectin type III domain-containing protein, partial [Hymenobacter sp. BT175]|uniref:fibronectin type III domain-containing protein n=1 Tax=Hymenobacter translucens TaxID=2886507 RepID=UPI001D0E6809